MEFTTKCEVCGKEYDNYFRTFYVEEKGIKTKVCSHCGTELLKNKEYVYHKEIPTYVDGADLVYKVLDSEEEALNYIKENTEENYIACMSRTGNAIIDVCKTEKFWWVRGYVKLTKGVLPYWEDVAEELYGKDWRNK